MRRSGIVLALALLVVGSALAQDADTGEQCVACHTISTPGIVEQWTNSRHFEFDVDCPACHKAESWESDAFEHYGEHIAVIVSPLAEWTTATATRIAAPGEIPTIMTPPIPNPQTIVPRGA